ncbi:Glutamate--tRNA ligase [Alphaproteobacteria bacterium SO-S41]|nr:Glutamate--tRNA ligase [Alphaproteobacteria bacterium SO-S41]
MTVTVRFAPSPTGKLHVGNARAAVLNWLFAHKEGGRFVLRLDDTDRERSTAEFAEVIGTDLAWLGLTHDAYARQSDRFPLYEEAAAKLKAAGRLYPAYETADELERRRMRQRARGLPPVYDRAALALSDDDRARLEGEGRKPHWRFKLNQTSVAWHDLVRGEVSIDTATVSDPVLIREDGQFLYTLPSVVDDIDLKISHVIRGEDHVVNTAAQIEIFEALGGPIPIFAHYPMIVGADGEKLSKRLGSLSLESLRADGIDPMAVNALLAKIGTSDPIEARRTLGELAAEFAFERISHAPARLDPDDLKRLSTKLLHLKPFEEVAPDLAALGVGGGAVFWTAIHDNLETLDQAVDWWRIVAEPQDPTISGDPVLLAGARLLPEGDLTEATWQPWTKAIGAATGLKGKDLFFPLRLALTGREHGPEMKKLIPLMGRTRVLARLRGERA